MTSYTATDISWSISYPRKSLEPPSLPSASKNYQTIPRPKMGKEALYGSIEKPKRDEDD